MESTSFEPFDSKSISSPEIFLDTSIYCSKHKGISFTERIDSVLSAFSWIGASTYSKVEYGNVILSVVQYLRDKMSKFNSRERLMSHVANVLPPQFHQAKITWAINLLDVPGDSDAEKTERALLRLNNFMLVGVDYIDSVSDSPLQDGTCCFWAKAGVRRLGEDIIWEAPRCSAKKKMCRVDEFFVANLGHFLAIKNAIDGLSVEHTSKQLMEFSRVIEMAQKDPSVLLDYDRGCSKLADAIIAIDSKAYKTVFTQNIKESDVLTKVLQQHLIFLPPAEERGVLYAERCVS